jgi:hypothetical protein
MKKYFYSHLMTSIYGIFGPETKCNAYLRLFSVSEARLMLCFCIVILFAYTV